ncbi:hypothetical protein FRX31_016981 [Thalictrum thalictroides]|uniref:Uncharacterized protein n=1 Tax=Thalictrum thalictroides TaxID=46969 RepID=A0A7J6WA18_THATH|nr:hypothetical protein FRX31_016981 [Thalictrum thalictroides]
MVSAELVLSSRIEFLKLKGDLSFQQVLNACLRTKQWAEVFWVLQQLKQQGLHPSSTTYGLTMEVYIEPQTFGMIT